MADDKRATKRGKRKVIPGILKALALLMAALFQIALMVVPVIFFQDDIQHIQWILTLFSILVVFFIVRLDMNPAYKIPWIVAIMAFPAFGGTLYVIYGNYHYSKKEIERGTRLIKNTRDALMSQPYANEKLAKEAPEMVPEMEYLFRYADAPAYDNTTSQFFKLGDDMFPVMLEELEKAEKFIFMEFFIVEEGEMLDPILEILERKAADGVEVRFSYDSFGSLLKTPKDFVKKLRKKGIQCYEFNTFRSIWDTRYNNRNHRKICVIDGKVGFTGGVNLADEYINRKEIYGHWKDTGIMIKGDAVWSLTTMFLSLWDGSFRKEDDILKYKAECDWDYSDGYYIPYTDYPVDSEAVGKNVYLNMINRARKSVYIMTPYLILDNVLVSALTTAAKSGLDIRIITPGVPDKKIVYMLTQSYYEVLIKAGVRIYEYTPGFVHAKIFLADNNRGVVGTINLDYRSLAHHYENAVWLYKTESLKDIAEDYKETLTKCHLVTYEESRRRSLLKKIILPILRLFAPLM